MKLMRWKRVATTQHHVKLVSKPQRWSNIEVVFLVIWQIFSLFLAPFSVSLSSRGKYLLRRESGELEPKQYIYRHSAAVNVIGNTCALLWKVKMYGVKKK